MADCLSGGQRQERFDLISYAVDALNRDPAAAVYIDAGAHADAYLWVKRVGESDGSCGRGEAPAGRFVSQYAIDLARNAG